MSYTNFISGFYLTLFCQASVQNLVTKVTTVLDNLIVTPEAADLVSTMMWKYKILVTNQHWLCRPLEVLLFQEASWPSSLVREHDGMIEPPDQVERLWLSGQGTRV